MTVTTVSVEQPRAEPKRRSFVDRLLAVFPVVALVLLVLVFYAVEAWSRKTPWVFTDELEWTQLSRSIAHSGQAARRGEPIYFKSIYAYLIAPFWWIHSTAAAYSAIKYANAVMMALAAVPTYLLARMLVTPPRRRRRRPRLGCRARDGVRDLDRLRRRSPTPTTRSAPGSPSGRSARAGGSTSRSRSSCSPAATSSARSSSRASCSPSWSPRQASGSPARAARSSAATGRAATRSERLVLALGALLLFNRVVLQHVHEWQFTSQYYKNAHRRPRPPRRRLASTIGLGALRRDRRPHLAPAPRAPRGSRLPRLRRVDVGRNRRRLALYTAVKAAYLSTTLRDPLGGARPDLPLAAPAPRHGDGVRVEADRLAGRRRGNGVRGRDVPLQGDPARLALLRGARLVPRRRPRTSTGTGRPTSSGWRCSRRPPWPSLAARLPAPSRRRGDRARPGPRLDALDRDRDDRRGRQARDHVPRQPAEAARLGRPATRAARRPPISARRSRTRTARTSPSSGTARSPRSTASTARPPGPGPTPSANLLSADGLLSDLDGVQVRPRRLGRQARRHRSSRANGVMTLYRSDGPGAWPTRSSRSTPTTGAPTGARYTYFKPGQAGTLKVSLGRLAYNGSAPAARRCACSSATSATTPSTRRSTSPSVHRASTVTVPNGSTQTLSFPVAQTPVRVELTIAAGRSSRRRATTRGPSASRSASSSCPAER